MGNQPVTEPPFTTYAIGLISDDPTRYLYSKTPDIEQRIAKLCAHGCETANLLAIYQTLLPLPVNYRAPSVIPALGDYETGALTTVYCMDRHREIFMSGTGVCGPTTTLVEDLYVGAITRFYTDNFAVLSDAGKVGLPLSNAAGAPSGHALLTISKTQEPLFTLNIDDPDIWDMVNIDLREISKWELTDEALILYASEMGAADVVIRISYQFGQLRFLLQIYQNPLFSNRCGTREPLEVNLYTNIIPLPTFAKEDVQ